MRKLILITFTLVFILMGCTNSKISKVHQSYLEERGWSINKEIKKESSVLELSIETKESYEASNINFFNDYLGKELSITKYSLREKDIEGESIIVYLYEFEGEIIGGIGVLPSWTPGVFNVDEKERLINEKMIR